MEPANLVFLGGIGQILVLIASALVPFHLNWRKELQSLSRLHRQMYWVYGGYIVLSIIAFALMSLMNSRELTSGSGLARGFCLYVAVFCGCRLVLQGVFDIREYLTNWLLKIGYHGLTLLFMLLAGIYAWVAFWTGG